VYLDLQMKDRATSLTAMDLEDGNLTQAVVEDIVVDKVTRPMQRDLDNMI
jgi:hypothetical protein